MPDFLNAARRALPLALGTWLTVAAAPTVARAQGMRGCGQATVLQTSAGTLEGTLRCPKGAGPWPVALLVPGAGRLDRDGNSPMHAERVNTFALLAEGLAERGIATLRYDKRGAGASRLASYADSATGFNRFAQDAAEWVQLLQVDDRFSSVTVVGHGEGALVGMLAARAADADGFVSLAGQGRPGDEIMNDRFGRRLPVELRTPFRRALASLVAGRYEEELPYELHGLLRPSAQLYLATWFRFDPPTEIARLRVPVLIVQGDADTEATVRDAQLLNAAQPRADALVLERVNHALRLASGAEAGRVATSALDERGPLADEVLEGLAAFLAQVRRR